MTLCETTDTNHLCSACGSDQDEDYRWVEGYLFPENDRPVGFWDDDSLGGKYSFVGWRCDECEAIHNEEEDTSASWYECPDCHSHCDEWSDAANCCVWVCAYDGNPLNPTDCACSRIDISYSGMLTYPVELCSTFAYITEAGEDYYICLFCHAIEDYQVSPSEHTCYQNAWDSFKHIVYRGAAADLYYALQVEHSSRFGVVLEEPETDTVAVDEELLILDESERKCEICQSATLCCVMHEYHKPVHKGCRFVTAPVRT